MNAWEIWDKVSNQKGLSLNNYNKYKVGRNMNKNYSLTPSSRGQIHSLLSPIFDLVRKNNIHSYYQLQKSDDSHPQKIQHKKGSYIFDMKPKTAHNIGQKTISNFSVAKQRMTHHSLYSPQDYHPHPQTPSINLSKISETIDLPRPRKIIEQKKGRKKAHSLSKTSHQKMFRVNSKIKKHLVQEIDFDQIQKMFYKKRSTLTRYQYFLKRKHENRSQAKGSIEKHAAVDQKGRQHIENKDDHFPLNQLPQYNISTHQEWPSPSKSPNRKKFWVKQPSKREIKNAEYPIIAGKSFMTINC